MAAKINSTKNKTTPAAKSKAAATKATRAGSEKVKATSAKPQGKPASKPVAVAPVASSPAKGSPAAKLQAAVGRKPVQTQAKPPHAAAPASKPSPKSLVGSAKSPPAQPAHVTAHVAPKPAVAPANSSEHKAPTQHTIRPVHSAVAPVLPPRPVLAQSHRPVGHGPSLSHKRSHGFGHNQPGQLPRDVIERNPTLKLDPNKKKTLQRHGFRTSEYVVYPSHGVGKIVAIEEQVVAGHALELFVINFEQEKMTLRVPTAKLAAVGMRKLSEDGIVHRAMETLKGRARVKRTMWSRRAQEYETKINSGDLVSISEVVRDLYRAETQPEQSYSERQLFEAALDRMSREIAAIEKLDERGAVQKITEVLSKSAKGRAATKAAEEAANSGGEAGEGQAA